MTLYSRRACKWKLYPRVCCNWKLFSRRVYKWNFIQKKGLQVKLYSARRQTLSTQTIPSFHILYSCSHHQLLAFLLLLHSKLFCLNISPPKMYNFSTKIYNFPQKYTNLAFKLKFIHRIEFVSADAVCGVYNYHDVWEYFHHILPKAICQYVRVARCHIKGRLIRVKILVGWVKKCQIVAIYTLFLG